MKKTYPLSLLLCLLFNLVIFPGCKKVDPDSILNNLPGGIPTGDDDPAYTAPGTAVGDPVTKTIGAAGGSIATDDGRIQLTIPAGALTTNTEISIQPTTNECPGGIGLAYNFLPDGTKFAKPATVTFHYTDDELGESDPYLLFVATQDSTYKWMADIIWRDVDTVAKTVMMDIRHFSGKSMGSGARISIDQDQLHKGEITHVQAVNVLMPPEPKGDGTGDDDLVALPISKPLPNVSGWRVNGVSGGNASVGMISGIGNTATYTAPASVPRKKTVTVSANAQITTIQKTYKKGRLIRTYKSTELLKVSGSIDLIPSFSYNVKVEYQELGTNECFADSYTDSATLQVDVEDDVVTVSNLKNYAPRTDPVTGPSPDELETCTWKRDSFGTVNITSTSGSVFPTGVTAPGVVKTVQIACGGQGFLAQWEVVPTGGTARLTGGQQFPTIPPQINFKLNDQIQTIRVTTPPNASGYSGDLKITITPRQ